uniref:Uncharacterized protein n=1 Tax=Tanacetum cinerariifolium TaxID=118510 RepID=A0A6L2KPA0_TANCI|nr:hypothetical protein [Tanacetum cinerariifolium]
MEEYVQFETEKALRNDKVYKWEAAKYGMINWCLNDVDIDNLRFFEPKFLAILYNDALKLKPDMSFEPTIDHDTNDNLQLDKGIDDDKAAIEPFSEGSPSNSCGGTTIIDLHDYLTDNNCDELSNGAWSTYVPNDEWKSMERERNDPKQGSQDSIGEYGLVINGNDLEHMCNYLLAKDALSFMNDMDERFDKKKLSLIGTPSDRIASLNKEFNN